MGRAIERLGMKRSSGVRLVFDGHDCRAEVDGLGHPLLVRRHRASGSAAVEAR